MTSHTRALSTRELADAVGVSESSIKRWADEGVVRAQKTAGGHRRIPMAETVRFLRASNLRLVRPEILGLRELAALTPSGEEEVEQLFRLLEAGAAPETRGLLLALYLEGRSVAQLMDGLLAPALARIGELWNHSPQGIFHEHRATDIVLQSLRQLRGLLPPAAETAPRALGGAPSGDPYVVASLAATLVLESLGYATTNLGAETPVLTLMEAAEVLKPRLVWLSVGAAPEPQRLAAEVELLAQWLAPRGGTLALGGRAAQSLGIEGSESIRRLSSLGELEVLGAELLVRKEI